MSPVGVGRAATLGNCDVEMTLFGHHVTLFSPHVTLFGRGVTLGATPGRVASYALCTRSRERQISDKGSIPPFAGSPDAIRPITGRTVQPDGSMSLLSVENRGSGIHRLGSAASDGIHSSAVSVPGHRSCDRARARP